MISIRPDRLRARLDALRTSGRPGGGRLEALLDARGDGRPMESALETLVWPLIVRARGAAPEFASTGSSSPANAIASTSRGPISRSLWSATGTPITAVVRVWNNTEARLAEFAAVGWRVLPVTWDAASRQTRARDSMAAIGALEGRLGFIAPLTVAERKSRGNEISPSGLCGRSFRRCGRRSRRGCGR